MRAVAFDGQLRLETKARTPKPKGDQALLKIRRAGICNTDLELVAGYMNFSGILGHEFVGEVVSGADDLMGRRVVSEINVADGTCDKKECSKFCWTFKTPMEESQRKSSLCPLRSPA